MGDEHLLEHSAGGQYLSCVTERLIVGPHRVKVMNAIEDSRRPA